MVWCELEAPAILEAPAGLVALGDCVGMPTPRERIRPARQKLGSKLGSEKDLKQNFFLKRQDNEFYLTGAKERRGPVRFILSYTRPEEMDTIPSWLITH